jgi:hypothetical protein
VHESGNRYKWHRSPFDHPLAAWPFPKPASPPPRAFTLRHELEAGRVTPKGRRMLDQLAAKVAQLPRRRHDGLFWASCRAGELIAQGLIARDVAHTVLLRATDGWERSRADLAGRLNQTIRDGLDRGATDAGAAR